MAVSETEPWLMLFLGLNVRLAVIVSVFLALFILFHYSRKTSLTAGFLWQNNNQVNAQWIWADSRQSLSPSTSGSFSL